MEYRCQKVLLTGAVGDEVIDLLVYLCHHANNLYNSALFSIRQAHFDSCPTRDYWDKNEMYRSGFKTRKVKANYYALWENFKTNPSYQALGGQQGQQCLKSVVEAVRSYNSLLDCWFLGEIENKPRIPGYRKSGGLYQVTYPGQAAVVDEVTGDVRLRISNHCKPEYLWNELWIAGGKWLTNETLAQVRIVPQLGKLWAEYVYKVESQKARGLDYTQAIGIDPGVDNWLTCVTTRGKSFIIDGHKVKSTNSRYNKRVSTYKEGKPQKFWDSKLDQWTHERNCFMRDAINKTARFIVNHCLKNGIGNIVFGWGQGVKTNANLGKRNNQNFVQIPTARLKERLRELATSIGITFTETSESYTSKASFLDGDFLPKFGEKPEQWKPSGRRVKRGLYRSGSGQLINADCNGAANILRKVTIQLGLALAEVGRGALTLPRRCDVFSDLNRSYRNSGERCLLTLS
ncbi:MAG: RNA-guided endonuclease InsQ/TnpB family protein [Xenococcaceae cyanobacterium]